MIWIFKISFQILEQDHFTAYLTSDHHTRYLLEALNNGGSKPKAKDVLALEDLLFAFVDFADSVDNAEANGGGGSGDPPRGRDLVEFWTAATSFRRQVQRQSWIF